MTTWESGSKSRNINSVETQLEGRRQENQNKRKQNKTKKKKENAVVQEVVNLPTVTRDGELIGKILMRDVNCQTTFNGHLKIGEKIKVKKGEWM